MGREEKIQVPTTPRLPSADVKKSNCVLGEYLMKHGVPSNIAAQTCRQLHDHGYYEDDVLRYISDEHMMALIPVHNLQQLIRKWCDQELGITST
jgi:hypothetical protein